VTSDSPAFKPITGDVIASSIRRLSGTPGEEEGLIEIPLHGHDFVYQVRVHPGPTPQISELTIRSRGDRKIDPAAVSQVPVRRLAAAARQFIWLTETGVSNAGDRTDPTGLARPDLEPPRRRRKLGDEHYREVAAKLLWAREMGLPARDQIAHYYGVSKPTLDRWIARAKDLTFLPRDWGTSTAATHNDETDPQ